MDFKSKLKVKQVIRELERSPKVLGAVYFAVFVAGLWTASMLVSAIKWW